MELDLLIIHHRMAFPISRLQTGFTADISNLTRWSWHKATSQWLWYVKLDGVTSFINIPAGCTMQVSQCSFEDPPLHQNMERYPGTSYNSSIQPYEIYYIFLAHWWPIMAVHISIYIIYSISLTKFTLLTVRLWVKTHTNPYASTNNLPNVPAPKKDEKGTCKRGMRSCFPASQHLAISRWEKMGRSSELQHVVANWYPLVISNIAIENGHRNSGFSH